MGVCVCVWLPFFYKSFSVGGRHSLKAHLCSEQASPHSPFKRGGDSIVFALDIRTVAYVVSDHQFMGLTGELADRPQRVPVLLFIPQP